MKRIMQAFILTLLIVHIAPFSVHAVDCSPPISGDLTVTADCAFSGTINGVDAGTGTTNTAKLTPQSGIITLNAGQTIAVGSLGLTGSGSIAINGTLKLGSPIWMVDADTDTYAASTQQYAQTSAPVGGVRRNQMASVSTADCDDATNQKWQLLPGYQDTDVDTYTTGSLQNVCSGTSLPSGWLTNANGSDCDDNSSAVYQLLNGCYIDGDSDTYGAGLVQNNVCGSASCASTAGYAGNSTDCNDSDVLRWRQRYLDNDADGYAPNATLTCVGNHTGYVDSVTGTNDCYDSSANAFPGETNYFTTNRGDGSFDYDCDGTSTRQYPSQAVCTETGCTGNRWQLTSTGWDPAAAIPACGASGNFDTAIHECQRTDCTYTFTGRTQSCR